MKAKSHIAGWTAACMIMTALFGGVASADSVIVTTGRLNMRKEADAGSKSVSVVEKDDALSFMSENGDWYQVRDGETDGYVMKEYVKLDITQIEADVEANTELYDQEMTGKVLTRVNMRSLPMTESEIVKVVAKNVGADVLGVCGDWYLIRSGGKTGYIMGEYLAIEDIPSAEIPEEAPANPADEEAAVITYAASVQGQANTRVNMRKQASTDSSVAKVVPKGASVTVTGEEGEWYAVTYGGKNGYVLKQYIMVSGANDSESGAASDEEIRYAAAEAGKASTRVNMRKQPTTGASIAKVVPKNASVTVTGEKGEWYAVTYGGKSGYVLKEYIAVSTVGGSQTDEEIDYAVPEIGVTTTRVNMRKQASTGATVVKVLSGKLNVSILGESGAWYRVSAGGKTGYVLKEYISAGEEIYTYDVTGRTVTDVNLREEANTSCKAIRVLKKGTEVKVIGKVSSWYCVTVDGAKGYVSSEYITLVTGSPLPDVEPEAGDDVVEEGLTTYPAARTGATNERVNMREAASSSATVKKILNKNTTVTVLGELNTFYQVKYGDVIGYIVKEYVTLGASGSADVTPAPDTNDGESDVLYAAPTAASTTVTVNMRREPEGDILHTLSAGVQVTLIGERGVWYKVIYGNSTGYIAMQYVTKNAIVPEQPEDDGASSEITGKGTKGYITAASVNLRRGAGTGYGIVKVLTKGEEITYYTESDGWYLVKAGGDTGYVSSKYVSETAPDTAPGNPGAKPSSGKVQQADWWTSNIQKIFKVGTIVTVTDVDTGLSWQVKRSGGSNHADVQPLTAEDTAKMKQAYNGKWSWDRHAIWVTIDGVRYAASMNGMPHGSGSITTNNFDGHHCIHFLNSRTHTGNRWDTAHQSMVQKAYKAGQ